MGRDGPVSGAVPGYWQPYPEPLRCTLTAALLHPRVSVPTVAMEYWTYGIGVHISYSGRVKPFGFLSFNSATYSPPFFL